MIAFVLFGAWLNAVVAGGLLGGVRGRLAGSSIAISAICLTGAFGAKFGSRGR